MSQAATIAEKIRAWARATEVRAEPLLACLACLQADEPEAIASSILAARCEQEDEGKEGDGKDDDGKDGDGKEDDGIGYPPGGAVLPAGGRGTVGATPDLF